jgi:hypothetical protein
MIANDPSVSVRSSSGPASNYSGGMTVHAVTAFNAALVVNAVGS